MYYIKPENKFVYVLSDVDFKDETDYNIAITAVNDKNEEIDNDNSIKDNKNIFDNVLAFQRWRVGNAGENFLWEKENRGHRAQHL